MRLAVLLLLLVSVSSIEAQCYDDRHNTSIANAWMSCNATSNPHQTRGNSHWVAYDFDEIRQLGEVRIWNINNPDFLNNGARQIAYDYSLDGENWTVGGLLDMPQAEGSGFYEGVVFDELQGISAKHLLLTIISNYGGSCYGLAEIKLGVEPLSSIQTEDVADIGFEINPNPASTITYLDINKTYFKGRRLRLQILDQLGRVVTTQDVDAVSSQSIPLALNINTDGQYLIRLTDGIKSSTQEITIINSNR